MSANYLNAICFDSAGKAYKFHNIKNTQFRRKKFEQFAKQKYAVIYVNWYCRNTRKFIEQTKIV